MRGEKITMNIRKLETFILLVEKQSFSEAAARLNCSQPAVSRQMKSLEKDLNVVLIDRHAAGISPTPAGRFLYQTAKDILQLWHKAEADIQRYQDTLSGNLMIGTSTIPGTYLLPRWIRSFRTLYPHVAVSIEIGDSKQMIEKLQNEQVDVAIVGAEPAEDTVLSKAIASDTLVVIAPNEHPLCEFTKESWNRLQEYDFVLREEGSGTRKVMERYLQQHDISLSQLRAVLHVGSTEALIAAVEEGVGISVVSNLAAIPAAKAERIKIIDEFAGFERTFYLAALRKKESNPIIKEFLAHFQE
ncbi:selenium metabolism-associated LysR family transcriptional regulator [Bacillus piscicola]|uniref:selenium metabolism-associated LysR family transcriptional regulator n=1 Tax=Bacillus piscicola TaxID=1632684 RepID=UPI001F089CE6|nr:selenium metabolism-associated LysR family transcriptional regulator [Bacillus piscicola]